MTTAAIRKKLISYLEGADEKKVKAIYALVENDIEQGENNSYILTDEQMRVVEERRANYLSGKSKGKSWEEVKNQLRRTRKKAG
jgi:hypothetical protein